VVQVSEDFLRRRGSAFRQRAIDVAGERPVRCRGRSIRFKNRSGPDTDGNPSSTKGTRKGLRKSGRRPGAPAKENKSDKPKSSSRKKKGGESQHIQGAEGKGGDLVFVEDL